MLLMQHHDLPWKIVSSDFSWNRFNLNTYTHIQTYQKKQKELIQQVGVKYPPELNNNAIKCKPTMFSMAKVLT
jgi:hypothetical protein